MVELSDYTKRLLGDDRRGRYTEYCSKLTAVIMKLQQSGVRNILDLKTRVESREKLEAFQVQGA
jgi:hypothetical protein